MGEARLLLLAALVIADELSDANDALERERNRAENASNGRDEAVERVSPIAAGLLTP